MGSVGRQAKDDDTVLLGEINERPGGVRIMAVQNQKPIVSRIIETRGCLGCEVFLEPKLTQMLIGPTVR